MPAGACSQGGITGLLMYVSLESFEQSGLSYNITYVIELDQAVTECAYDHDSVLYTLITAGSVSLDDVWSCCSHGMSVSSSGSSSLINLGHSKESKPKYLGS